MTSTTKAPRSQPSAPAHTRRSEREVPIPYREIKHLVAETFGVPMATHGKGKGKGGAQFYPSIEGLRLTDGTERYRCTAVADCPHTYTTWGKVRFHIGVDHPNPRKTLRRQRAAAATGKAPEAAVKASEAELVLPEPAPAKKPAAAPAPEPVVVPAPATPLTEAGLDGMVRTFSALAESRNGWRARAEAAEKQVIVEKERADRAEENLADLQARLRKLTEG